MYEVDDEDEMVRVVMMDWFCVTTPPQAKPRKNVHADPQRHDRFRDYDGRWLRVLLSQQKEGSTMSDNAMTRGSQLPDAEMPRSAAAVGSLSRDLNLVGLPPSMAILLDDGLYRRVQQLAVLMSKAAGMTPRHLIGQGEACFQVITNALDWKLNYNFVARHTYQTPGGSIGYDGALTQAILEKSGTFVGMPTVEYVGDWNQVTGKYKLMTSQKGGEFPVRTWTDQDAVGLGAIIRWRLRNEDEPRAWPGEGTPFWLTQVYPLNSPLWATDPRTQIRYLMIRRFANQTVPGVLGAAAFDDEQLLDAADRARDITPSREEPRRPNGEGFGSAQQQTTEVAEAELPYPVVDADGVITDYADLSTGLEAFAAMLQHVTEVRALDARWDDNQKLFDQVRDELGDAAADGLAQQYGEYRAALAQKEAEQQQPPPPRRGRPRKTPQEAAGAPQGQPSAETPPPAEAGPSASPPAAADAVQEEPGAEEPEVDHLQPTEPVETVATGHAAGVATATAVGAVEERLPLVIACPTDRMGRKDMRTWGMALFLPRMRRTKSPEDLHFLIEDNHENFELCRQPGTLDPNDLATFKADVAAQWKSFEDV